MAEVIELARHRAERASGRRVAEARRSRTAQARSSSLEVPAAGSTTLYFDLASPDTYLVAEQVERRIGDAATWRPAVLPATAGVPVPGVEEVAAAAARRASVLRMPLVWPERFPQPVPCAMRVATYAAEEGCGGAFAIAAGRLAFCGGFDIEDPEIIAEAAAAAGLDVDAALASARETGRDRQAELAGCAVVHAGGSGLPALEHGRHVYCGEATIRGLLAQVGGTLARRRAF